MFALYIHWPFCASKCPYCDFNSHVSDNVDHPAWRESYAKEMAFYAGLTKGRKLTSIFFGGGTPSLMPPETVQSVIDKANELWGLEEGCEITLEANPTSVEIDKFTAFRAAGVNRVSIGVQSLDNAQLKFLGRQHDASEAIKAIETAAKTFDRYSFDLIYARPEQTIEEWRKELKAALELAGSHLSLYQLTIEPGTAFHTWHGRGDFSVPGQDDAGELYEVTQEILEQAGLPAYEVSNHARPGHESIHNLTYWRYGDYVGIGPGAHGRLSQPIDRKLATRAHRAPERWLQLVAEKGHGAHPFVEISKAERFEEALMMGLRLREGLDLDFLSEQAGKSWDQIIKPHKIRTMVDEELLTLAGTRLKPTLAGLQRLNGILRYLLT